MSNSRAKGLNKKSVHLLLEQSSCCYNLSKFFSLVFDINFFTIQFTLRRAKCQELKLNSKWNISKRTHKIRFHGDEFLFRFIRGSVQRRGALILIHCVKTCYGVGRSFSLSKPWRRIWRRRSITPVILYLGTRYYVLFVLCRSLYCLCVNAYCTTAIGWLPNCS